MDDIDIDHYIELIHDKDNEIESIRTALAEAEKYRQDAERYRWIRERGNPAAYVCLLTMNGRYRFVWGDDLDSRIDAAIANEPKTRSEQQKEIE